MRHSNGLFRLVVSQHQRRTTVDIRIKLGSRPAAVAVGALLVVAGRLLGIWS